MKTLSEFAATLSSQRQRQGVTLADLAATTGLSPLAISQMLGGTVSPRLSNAMAVASALGFEMVLMPKAAAQSFEQAQQGARTVLTDLERTLGETVDKEKP